MTNLEPKQTEACNSRVNAPRWTKVSAEEVLSNRRCQSPGDVYPRRERTRFGLWTTLMCVDTSTNVDIGRTSFMYLPVLLLFSFVFIISPVYLHSFVSQCRTSIMYTPGDQNKNGIGRTLPTVSG